VFYNELRRCPPLLPIHMIFLNRDF
jgi:hypothetical protein